MSKKELIKIFDSFMGVRYQVLTQSTYIILGDNIEIWKCVQFKGRSPINYISVEFWYFKPDIRFGEIMDGLRELEQVRLIMRADLPYIGVHPTPITFKHNFHLWLLWTFDFLEYQLFSRSMNFAAWNKHWQVLSQLYDAFATTKTV